jgi:hypothetical protein
MGNRRTNERKPSEEMNELDQAEVVLTLWLIFLDMLDYALVRFGHCYKKNIDRTTQQNHCADEELFLD